MILIISFCAVVSVWVGIILAVLTKQGARDVMWHTLFCYTSMMLASFIWNW